MTFGEKLQVLRKENGMSQEALAEKINVSRQAVSKWELDVVSPDTDNIVFICKYFQVPIEYMLLNEYDSLEEYYKAKGSNVDIAGAVGKKNWLAWIFCIGGVAFMILSVFICYPFQMMELRNNGEACSDPLDYLLKMPIVLLFMVGVAGIIIGVIIALSRREEGMHGND